MKQQQELIPMATGEYLKQQRAERNLTLSAIAKAISLDENLLRAIEQDQASHIALVYKNGYIQTYARYLQVPEDKIQSLISSPEHKEPPIRNIFSKPPKRDPMDKWLRATSYVLASLLIGTLAWQFTHEAVRLSQNGSSLHSTEGNSTVAENGSNQPQAQKITGTVNASIAPLGILHDSNTAGLDTAEQAWAAVSPSPVPEGENSLQISVSADSWVEITDDNGQDLEMDLLRAGSEKSYHGKAPFRILFGSASAVQLAIDGEAVDLTAFTHDGIVQLTWPSALAASNNETGDH